MERIDAQIITGARNRKQQIEWFEDNGFRYAIDIKGKVFTTDDWMNLKDKAHDVSNDDGFDLSFLENADDNKWLDENIKTLPVYASDIFEGPSYQADKNNVPAVYMLFDDGVLVYVGQCLNLRKRLNNHSHNGVITFDAFRVIPNIPHSAFKHVEAFYINLFKPKFNTEIPRTCKTASEFIKRL